MRQYILQKMTEFYVKLIQMHLETKCEQQNLIGCYINTFTPRLIQTVCAKTPGSHMALHGNFSAPVSATDPVKSSKDSSSLVVCTKKKFLVGGIDFL